MSTATADVKMVCEMLRPRMCRHMCSLVYRQYMNLVFLALQFHTLTRLYFNAVCIILLLSSGAGLFWECKELLSY